MVEAERAEKEAKRQARNSKREGHLQDAAAQEDAPGDGNAAEPDAPEIPRPTVDGGDPANPHDDISLEPEAARGLQARAKLFKVVQRKGSPAKRLVIE